MNATCIQSEEIEKKIIQLNKKLHRAHKQLTLVRQNALKALDKLNQKSHHNLAFISNN